MGHKGIWAKLTDTATPALRSRSPKKNTPDKPGTGKQNTTTNTIGPNNAGTAVQAHTIHGGIGNTTHITNTTTVQPQRALLLALDSVPAPPGGFVGRGDELAAVCARLEPANDKDDNAPSSGAVVVSALAGMGGVGKTALALKAAQIASDANWFCAHLFVDLHSYTPHTPPLAATGALDVLLRQMGIDPADIPPGLDERSAFYRSALQALTRADQQGRPALVVADNAHHLDQIRPLLPGPGAHRLLVTSRQALAIDGHRPLTLDALPPDQAVELLQARLGPNDPRRTQKDELQTLAQRCGYLPLALKIAAALLARPPHLTPGRLAHRLAELSTFSDGEHDLTAVFTASLEHLPTNQVRIFALLGANPGTDISTTAAAFMVGAQNPEQTETVERALEELATAHLITSPGPDRWAMHDLVAQHARTLNPPPATKNKPGWKKTRTKWTKRLDEGDEGDLALDRVLHLYMTMAEAANDHLRTRKSNIPLEVFPDREAALTWLDTEIDNLLACVRTAHHTHRAQTAMHLPTFLGTYLNLRRRFDDAIEAHTLACQSAQQAGAVQHEAGAWTNLGTALLEVRRFDEAIDALTHA
ncbi:AAA family ATPase, partial [Nocardiopsis dassonvillei]